jgi:hypothetical protein
VADPSLDKNMLTEAFRKKGLKPVRGAGWPPWFQVTYGVKGAAAVSAGETIQSHGTAVGPKSD